MIKYLMFVCCLIPFFSVNAAELKKNIKNHYKCHPTKAYYDDCEPINFLKTNNLLRKSGEKASLNSKKVIIKGRVLDKSCVPVSDAVVHIWQMDDNGKYPYEPLKQVCKKANKTTKKKKSSFCGNGTALTNNNGEFYFVTKASAAKDMINIRITHDETGTLDSHFLLNPKYHDGDVHSSNVANNTNNNLVHEVEIVMSKNNKYRRY